MIALISVFWIMLLIFAVIGMLRGWAKEVVASAGIVLALFALDQFGNALFPDIPATETQAANEFTVRMVFFLGVVFFSYQTPAAADLWASRQGSGRRFEWLSEGLQQRILGFIIGFFNGWLVIGTVWSYADVLNYPFGPYVIHPQVLPQAIAAAGNAEGQIVYETTMSMINSLPLNVLGQSDIVLPLLVVVLFLFVIVVMI